MSARIREWFSSSGTTDWVERMILNESVDHPTRTSEYVVRHNIALQRMNGRQPGVGPGELLPESELVERHRSEAAVTEALECLERKGFIRRADRPADAEGRDGEWWELTEEGRAERDALRRKYEREVEDLRFEYGVFESR